MGTKKIALQGPAKPCPDAQMVRPFLVSGGMT